METLILDPPEVATARTALDITAYAKADGIDWGDAAIEAYMSDRERGSAPVDFRIPNRQIVIPMNVKAVGAITFATARRNLQAKVARIQAEGGWLSRTTTSGKLFLDVVNATLHFGGDWMQASRNVDVNAELRLEAIPDWYGPEVILPDHVDTTNGDLIFTETNIPGDYPGRMRLVVDDDQGIDQQGLLFGIRCRHYSNSTTAQLRYVATAMTPLDAAVVSGSLIRHQSISTSWTPVLSTNLVAGGTSLTHTGTYRVWIRGNAGFTSNQIGNLRFRLIWDVGDFALPTENAPVAIPNQAAAYMFDLGQVRLDRVPSGVHRWQGVIQAAGVSGGETVQVTHVYLVPVDEGYGVLRAPVNVDPGLNAYIARDEFNQTAGALTGKTAPVGGVWAGAGDTDDFVVNAQFHIVLRTASGDGLLGRFALAGTGTYSNVVSQVDFSQYQDGAPILGVFARYTDTNNFLLAYFTPLDAVVLIQRLGGVDTQLGVARPMTPGQGQFMTLRLWADTAGRVAVWMFPQGGSSGSPVISTTSTNLASGTLASGRVGFYDKVALTTGPLPQRNYDNFASWVPQQDAVLFANQSAELRTEGMFREDPTGTAFGPVSHVVGDLPRIPASGAEGRTVQFFVKASRGDFDTLPDTGVDDLSGRVAMRASYLLTL